MDVKETLIDCNFLSRSSSVSALRAQSAKKLLAFVDVAFAGHAFGKDPWTEHSYAVSEDIQHEHAPYCDHTYMTMTRDNDHSYSTVGKSQRSKVLDAKEDEKIEVPYLQRRASTGSENHSFAEENFDKLTSSQIPTQNNPYFHDSCFALKSRHCFSLEMINNIYITNNKKDLTLDISDPDISRIVLDGKPTRPAVLPQQMDMHSVFDHSYAVSNHTNSTMPHIPKRLEYLTETKMPDGGHSGGQIWNNSEISRNEFLKSPFLDHSYQLVERKRFKMKNSSAQLPFLDHSYQTVKMQNLRNQNPGAKRDGSENVSNVPIRSPYFDHSYDSLLTFDPNSTDKTEPLQEPLYMNHSYEAKNKGNGLKPSISCKTDHSYFISNSPTDSGTGSNLEDEDDIEMNLIQFHKDHTYTTKDTL